MIRAEEKRLEDTRAVRVCSYGLYILGSTNTRQELLNTKRFFICTEDVHMPSRHFIHCQLIKVGRHTLNAGGIIPRRESWAPTFISSS